MPSSSSSSLTLSSREVVTGQNKESTYRTYLISPTDSDQQLSLDYRPPPQSVEEFLSTLSSKIPIRCYTNFKMEDNWQDITQDFKSSVEQLNLGELVKIDRFTLLEAMSAIELMDPKMDSGMLLKKSNRRIMTLEQSIRSGAVKTNHLELNELIGIIDDTYSCLTTWLEGNSLAQTVMTNLYLHEPDRIEDRCLRIFSQSILKIVDFLDKLVEGLFCIEEEDFQTNASKFPLANRINDQKLMSSLEDLCQYYENLHKQVLAEKQSTKTATTQSKDESNKENLKSSLHYVGMKQSDEAQLAGLVDRIRFTYSFYECFFNISRIILKNSIDSQTQTDAHLLKTVKLVQSSTLTCSQHLERCLKYLGNWKKSIELGIKPEPLNISDTSHNEGDYPTIMGFEPLINHKLLPPAYPRCPSIKSRPSTLDYLKDLIIRLEYCITISVSSNHKSFDKSLELFENFSKCFRSNSCVISRMFIQTLYLPNRSNKLLKDELLQSLTDFCSPLIQLIKKDPAKSEALQGFLAESSEFAFSQVMSIYGHNTARQHEKFPDLIQSFKNLQCSSFKINGVFKNNIIYSWTTLHLARLCIKYVQLGLELELFSYHEYPYVYWYLYDILYRNEREQLELAKHFIYESHFIPSEDMGQKKIKSKKQRSKKVQQDTSFHDKNLISNDAFRFLTGGIFLLTYGLRLQGKIKTPKMVFTSEEICFDNRFGALTGATVYHSYKQTLIRLEKLEHIYREALECFSEAKEIFQTSGEHEDCLKVCKANVVVARILSSNLNSVQDREVEFCFDIHPSFPTVKV